MPELRPQSRWLVRKIARESDITESEAEQGLIELIARGHLRVIPCAAPFGDDAFEPVIRTPAQ